MIIGCYALLQTVTAANPLTARVSEIFYTKCNNVTKIFENSYVYYIYYIFFFILIYNKNCYIVTKWLKALILKGLRCNKSVTKRNIYCSFCYIHDN